MTMAQHDRLARQHERSLLKVLEAYRGGDLTARLPDDWRGLDGQVAEALNQVLDRANDTRSELERLASLDGDEGSAADREPEAVLCGAAATPGKQPPAIRPPPWWLERRVKHLCREFDRRAGDDLRQSARAGEHAGKQADSGPTLT